MQFANKKNEKILGKLIFPTLIAVLVLFIESTHFAHAQAAAAAQVGTALAGGSSGLIGDIAYTVIGKVFFGIAYLIAWMAGIAIAVEAWLIGVVLNINTTVFNSAIVQQGFGVTLSIANLGFVLGIIIIALATILRRESYGVKQLLWKLVVAAILVNFGLVIMAPIFNLGNSFTQYFLNCIDVSVGCNNTSGLSAGTSMNDFAVSLAGAFNPQNGFLSLNQVGSGSANINSIQGAFSAQGSNFSKMLVPMFSLLFVGASLTVIVITLGALVVLLLIRYIAVCLLAVLLPFAWLSWVFPKFSSHWSKWWSNFIQWTVFAPAVIFFLYLAMLTTKSMSTATSAQSFAVYTSNSNAIWASISGLFTNFFSPIIQNLLNQFVLIGLCVGGMIAAKSFSVAGADVVKKAAGAIQETTVGYVGKQSKKGARAAYRKAGGEKLTQNLQRGNAGILGRIPLVGGVARRGATLAGGRIASVSDNSAMVDEAKKNIPGKKEDRLRMMEGSMNTETRMALFEAMEKDNQLNDVQKINGEEREKWLDNNKKDFASYGRSGDGSLEEKVWDKTKLTERDALAAKKPLEEKNKELDAKRNATEEAINTRAGLNDDDRAFYERTKEREQNPEDLLTAAEETRYLAIKAKQKKAKSEIGLTPEEQAEYEKNREDIDKAEGKIMRGNKDPDVAASHFIDAEKTRRKLSSEGKEIPPWLEEKRFKESQEEFLKVVAKKYSPQNMSELMKAVGKTNSLGNFESAIAQMRDSNKEGFDQLTESISGNKGLLGYIRSSSGKGLTPQLNEMFDIRDLKQKKGQRRGSNDDHDDDQPQQPPAQPAATP